MKELVALLVTATAVGAGIYATLKKPGGSLSGARRRRSGLRGEHEQTELEQFCDNDGDIYRSQRSYVEKALARRIQKGTYNHELAKKAWGHVVESCAKKYVKEFGTEDLPWHKLFSTADRRQVAKNMADFFYGEWKIRNKAAG